MTVSPDTGNPASPVLTHILHPDAEVRGVWIASVFNIDYPSRADLSADQLRAEIDAILDTCEKNNLNTVFFQVRPSCDALYKSDIFPVSSSLSSSGTLVFDPLEYIVTEGHRRNIRIHAWVNPLRVTVSPKSLDSLPENSPARKNPGWVVEYADGKLYFNAGLPEVQSLVTEGVAEIVRKYDVDGIVFDDYFYPYPVNDESGKQAAFNDSEAYKAYGSGQELADWRRGNINTIIRSVYETVHSIDPECVFGVSPFAIWQNDNGKNGGSATNGFEGYNSLYCDALAWIEGGYIDYISPQIYWTFDSKSSAFDVLTKWWNAAVDGSNVKLIVSHASYRYEEGEWDSPEGQLTEQITFARAEKAYRGSMFYGYDEIKRNIRGASDDLLSAYGSEIIYMDIVSNGRDISVTSPENGSVTSNSSTYIIGMCDPCYPLTVTGPSMPKQKVSMTKSGYFNLYTELKNGDNTFIFEQNGKEYLHTITKRTGIISSGETEDAPVILYDITPKITYPVSPAASSEGILWVQCTAPYGSEVSVTIGGVTTKLEPLDTPKNKWPAAGYAAVTYGADAVLPKAADGEVLSCGNPVFTLSHWAGNASAEGAPVRVLGEGAYLCVRARQDYTHLKITEKSSYYNDYTVQSAGMTALAVSQQNGFYKLKMGGYISADAVDEIRDQTLFPSENGTISASSVSSAGRNTEIRFTTTEKPPYNGCIEEGRFVLTLYGINSESAPMPSIGKNPLIESCEIIRLDDRVRYSFALRNVYNFYGFDLRYEENAVIVSLRNPAAIDLGSDKPLSGVSIVLDAGHGGWDRGAAGAFSASDRPMNEEDLNLEITLAAGKKLTDLGADVIFTRLGDETVSLEKRMTFLEETEPDLCISIHQNSMDFTSDITRIRGTLALWCMDAGRLLSDCVGRSVSSALGRNYRGNAYQMLAVCRNPKFPQALIEVGFITSVEEYELITSQDGISRAAEGIADGVLDYFRVQASYLNYTENNA